MVRPPRSIALLVLAGIQAFSAAASAQAITARGVFAGAFEYTDNANFMAMNAAVQQDRTAAATAGPRPGFTLNLNPAGIVSYETPRSLTELQYTLNFATVLGIGDQLNYTNRLELRTRYDVSDLTVTNYVIRATQGQQNLFPEPQPGAATTLVVPGQFTFGTVEGNQNVNHRLSPDVVFTEQAAGTIFYPIASEPARPSVYTANAALALQYNDDPTFYGVTLNSNFVAPGDVACEPPSAGQQDPCGAGRTCAVATHRCVIDSTVTPENRKILEAKTNPPTLASRLAATVRHDFKNGFTGELDLGVQQIMRLTDTGGQNWQPTGRLAIRFAEEDIQAGLTFNHGTQLNIDLGTIVLADTANLVAAIPLDRRTRRLMLQLQAAYQRGTIIDSFGALKPGFHVAGGDAALTYRPENLLPNLFFALRYTFRYQITEPAATGGAVAYDLHAMRNAVGLNLGFEFPEKRPAQ